MYKAYERGFHYCAQGHYVSDKETVMKSGAPYCIFHPAQKVRLKGRRNWVEYCARLKARKEKESLITATQA